MIKVHSVIMDGIFYLFVSTIIYYSGVVAGEITCPDNEQSFQPQPTNCSQFIECNGGVIKVQNCIAGLHFDAARGYCDFPEEANCKVDVEDSQKDEDSDESFIYWPGGLKSRTAIEDHTCPATGQHFLPHPYSCLHFIECNNGVYSVIDCIAGLHFNPNSAACDFPENVGCVDSTPEPPTTTEGGPVGRCPPSNGLYVHFLTHSKNCSIFYMCNWGRAIEMKCPAGLHFSPTLHVCDWPQRAGCKV